MEQTEYTEIVTERRLDALWIGLNRPEVRNAFREQTLDEIARAQGKTPNALYMMMHRIRKQLVSCVNKTVREQGLDISI